MIKFLIPFLLIPISIYSQNWQFENTGNAFDGFKKVAFTINSPEDELYASLGVLNFSENRIIKWGDLGGNGIDNLKLILILKEQILADKLLMSFDEEKAYFILNYYEKDNQYTLLNAYSKDYKLFLSLLDIISNLKNKNILHLRAIAGEKKYDFKFTLKGSGLAINKSFVCPDYQKSNNWTDAFFENFHFAGLFTEVKNSSENLISFGLNCQKYFDEKYGPYFFTQINSIESIGNTQFPKLIFKNFQGDIVAEIDKSVYLKNYYHFSGKKKIDSKKDTDTIKLYYDLINIHSNIIQDKKITLDSFISLSSKDLLPFFNEVISNEELLEHLRKDEDIFYEYSKEEYTFEVFSEAWGKESIDEGSNKKTTLKNNRKNF